MPLQVLRSSPAVRLQNTYQSHHRHLQIAVNITRQMSRVLGVPPVTRRTRTLENFGQSYFSDRRDRESPVHVKLERQPLRVSQHDKAIVAEQQAKKFSERFERQEAGRGKSATTTRPAVLDDANSQSVTSLLKVKPVAAVVVRRSPAVPEPAAAEVLATDSSRSARTGTRKVVPRESQPAVDLNRLTDEVIQAIDRRILSQRERLGRF